MFIYIIFNFYWFGNIFIIENNFNVWFFFLSFFIGLMINFNDKNLLNKILIKLLIMICLFYFFIFNLLILYIFFELSLIPIIIMSLMFGMQIEKINSVYYLFFYSFFSSFPFLFLIFYLPYFNIFFLKKISYELLFFMILMFLVKFPIYFLHFWLPKLHVEASTSASMILAGLLLKFGTQGLYRFLKMMIFYYNFLFFFISMLGFLLGSFICFFQSDIKSLVAFSSVVHMSFLFFLFLNFINFSKMSSFILMISHGLISTIIFFFLGEFLHFNLTRLIYFFNSIFFNNIFFLMFFNIFLMLNSGFPPNISFFSEMIGFFVNLNFLKFNFFIIGVFMFMSFLFNFFLIINFNLGKKLLLNKMMSIFFSFGFLYFSFNFLIFL